MLALQKLDLVAGLSLREIESVGPVDPGDVLIKVSACGICGSDIHAYKLDADYEFMRPHLPLTMGHEFSGAIVDSNQSNFASGQRVTVIPSIGCGRCNSCRCGEERDCDAGQFVGYTRPGGFAHFVAVPARNCITVPENVDDELAALCEPLTIGAEAVLTGGVSLGDAVLILGAGTIGQAAALMAREAGARRIVIVGRDDALRLQTFRQLGFDETIDVASDPLIDQLGTLSRPFDCAIEATGSVESFSTVLPLMKKGGVVVAAGIYGGQASVDLTKIVRSRLQVRATYRSETATWFKVLALLAASPEAFRPLISHRLALADAEEGFRLALSREASKVLLFPN